MPFLFPNVIKIVGLIFMSNAALDLREDKSEFQFGKAASLLKKVV